MTRIVFGHGCGFSSICWNLAVPYLGDTDASRLPSAERVNQGAGARMEPPPVVMSGDAEYPHSSTAIGAGQGQIGFYLGEHSLLIVEYEFDLKALGVFEP